MIQCDQLISVLFFMRNFVQTQTTMMKNNSFHQLLGRQLHGIQKSFRQEEMSIRDFGSLLPASVMIQELTNNLPSGVSYMNNWGCERLGTDAETINGMGIDYYQKFFVAEEVRQNMMGIAHYLRQNDPGKQYNFFQRVRLTHDGDYHWFYTVCRLAAFEKQAENQKLIILSSPVEGIDDMISKVSKVLDEHTFIKNNYRIFAELTKREKEIITLIAQGHSSRDIAQQLFVSVHTINTHRKNIIRKTNCTTFAALMKFALAFDLV